MRELRISPNSDITLESNQRQGTTPAKAISEAIRFREEHQLESVELHYGGFTMLIDETTDFKELLSEYYGWLELQKIKDCQTKYTNSENTILNEE